MNENWDNNGDSGNLKRKDVLDCGRIIYLSKKYKNIELAKMVVDLENKNYMLTNTIVKIGMNKDEA